MLCAYDLRVVRDLYRAVRTIARDLGVHGLIRRTDPCSRLLRQATDYWGSILTRIPSGLFPRESLADWLIVFNVRSSIFHLNDGVAGEMFTGLFS